MHTVIIGGGFAGVKAALEISRRQLGPITLVSDETYFLHHASLYATATGHSQDESVIPLADIFASHADVTIVHASLLTVDSIKKVVSTTTGETYYDTLIIAIGMMTSYFNNESIQSHSYGIKTLDEVTALRQHIKQNVISGSESDYVIVGAGPSGVELAGALGQYIEHLTANHALKGHATTIHLVDIAERVLPRASRTASKMVTSRLRTLGVKIHMSSNVDHASKASIRLGGKLLRTHSLIWTAGVKNHPFFASRSDVFEIDKSGRVIVDATLMAATDIYVLGDNAATKNGGVAWTALAQACFMAEHLSRQLMRLPPKTYEPPYLIQSFPVGDKWAYVEWHGLCMAGLPGFIARRALDYRSYRQVLPPVLARGAWNAYQKHQE